YPSSTTITSPMRPALAAISCRPVVGATGAAVYVQLVARPRHTAASITAPGYDGTTVCSRVSRAPSRTESPRKNTPGPGAAVAVPARVAPTTPVTRRHAAVTVARTRIQSTLGAEVGRGGDPK